MASRMSLWVRTPRTWYSSTTGSMDIPFSLMVLTASHMSACGSTVVTALFMAFSSSLLSLLRPLRFLFLFRYAIISRGVTIPVRKESLTTRCSLSGT